MHNQLWTLEDLLTHVQLCDIEHGNPLMGDRWKNPCDHATCWPSLLLSRSRRELSKSWMGRPWAILSAFGDRLAGTDALIVVDAANIGGKSAGEVQLF
ncbi:MAG: hypothetical protein IPL59_16840 [Candidatus Competibacteraceae bacterium]|nr:hypothetical protein [Candidatus Competibacteraceae bacterium]